MVTYPTRRSSIASSVPGPVNGVSESFTEAAEVARTTIWKGSCSFFAARRSIASPCVVGGVASRSTLSIVVVVHRTAPAGEGNTNVRSPVGVQSVQVGWPPLPPLPAARAGAARDLRRHHPRSLRARSAGEEKRDHACGRHGHLRRDCTAICRRTQPRRRRGHSAHGRGVRRVGACAPMFCAVRSIYRSRSRASRTPRSAPARSRVVDWSQRAASSFRPLVFRRRARWKRAAR